MFFFSYTAAALSVFFLGTAAFIFWSKRSEAIARYFALYIFFVGVWIGANAMADFARDEDALRLWCGIALFGGSFFISYYMTFAEFFAEEHPITLRKKIFFFGPSIIFTPLGFTSLYVTETFFPVNAPTQILPGNINYAVLLFTIVGMIYGLAKPLTKLRSAPMVRQWQIMYISIGFFVTMVGLITFTIILPFMGELHFFTLGPQFTLITIALTAYAIFRHQLLDIRIVIQKSILYSALLTLIVGFYIFILFLFNFLFGPLTNTTTMASALLTTIAGIAGTPYVKTWFKKKTDNIFFKDSYDYSTAIQSLSAILNTNIERAAIVSQSAEALGRIFKTHDVTITSPASEGYRAYDARVTSGGTEIHTPIIAGKETIGWVELGRKLSGDLYTEEDRMLVETFACQAAVALEKATLYEGAKKHSAELEEKVQERTQEIVALQANERQMIIDISHGLQTPLTILTSELDNLKQEFPNTKGLKEFQQSVDIVSTFVYDLLNLARLEHSTERPEAKRVDMSAIVNDTIEYVAITSEKRGITVRGEITDGVEVIGEKERLTEAFINLLSNAIKYMGRGRIKEIIITLTVDSAHATLSVRDTGIGIAKEDLGHIFERFYRVNKPGVARARGTGVGLPIVKRIVERHNGTISVESTLGEGSTFTITLPRAQGRDAA